MSDSEYTLISIKNNYNNLHFCTRTYNTLKMICNSLYLYPYLLPRIFTNSHLIIDPLKLKSYNWKDKTKGLYVIIHGLLGTPKLSALTIAKYIDDNYHDEFDIIVPHKGNCTLEQAGNPILDIIVDFINKHPTKPIHLIGSSNGSRIVSYLEIVLRTLRPNTKIKITSIGGVYYGSDALYYLKFFKIANCVLHENIISSLTTGSNESINLINSMQLNTNISRTYEFYATANDWYIPNFNSCYPILNGINDVTYHEPITGIDHVFLGHYLTKRIVDMSVIWMYDNNTDFFN